MGSDEDMASRNQPVLSSNGQRTAEPSASFTPGPWQIRDSYTLAGERAIIANVDGEYVDGRAECTFDVVAVCEDEFGDHLPNASANARLIAAAPELYEALRALLDEEIAHVGPYAGQRTIAARAVLAKLAPPPQGVNATGAEAFPDNHLNEGD